MMLKNYYFRKSLKCGDLARIHKCGPVVKVISVTKNTARIWDPILCERREYKLKELYNPNSKTNDRTNH